MGELIHKKLGKFSRKLTSGNVVYKKGSSKRPTVNIKKLINTSKAYDKHDLFFT